MRDSFWEAAHPTVTLTALYLLSLAARQMLKPSFFERKNHSFSSPPPNSWTFIYKSKNPFDSLNLFQINIVLQSFAITVHNLLVRDCERHHYNCNQRISFRLCWEGFLPLSIMFFVKSHKVRNNNRILLNWICHHDRKYNTPF